MSKFNDKDNFFVKVMEATGTPTGQQSASNTANGGATATGDATQILQPTQKYKNTQVLARTQIDPSLVNSNTTNFKQDYVVIIRKKLFYAATAQDGPNGESPEENYLRVYQVNNFLNIHTSNNVHGKRPGTCSVTIRGGERVVCAEKDQQKLHDWANWESMLMGWTNIDNDGTTKADTAKKPEEKKSEGFLNQTADYLKKILGGGEEAAKAGTKWTVANDNWAISKNGQAAAGTDFKNLLKAREAKYGWRFAEKCDWEPMDEIYIFGKSRTEREDDAWVKSEQTGEYTKIPGKGAFKMNQLFFGYIDAIEKTYQADKGGLLIRVTATDHLKLLEISRIMTGAGPFLGKQAGGGLQIDWDKSHFGMFVIRNPWEEAAKGVKDSQNTETQLKMTGNVFTGLEPHEILKQVSLAAGIPKKYLDKRIEPIKTIPFVPQIRNGANGDFQNSETKTRLQVCNEVSDKMFLEFFADEQGNLVFKIPNYVVGMNKKDANNLDNPNLKWDDKRFDAVVGAFKIVDRKTAPEEQKNIGNLEKRKDEKYPVYNPILKKPLTDEDAQQLEKEIKDDEKKVKDLEAKLKKTPKDETTIEELYLAKKQQMKDNDLLQQHKQLLSENKKEPERTHTIEEGDNLWNIAIKYYQDGTKYGKIMEANGLESTVITPEQPALKIPSLDGADRQSRADIEANKEAMAASESKQLVRTASGKTISELTDQHIPIIEDKYVISFTLIDTDREVFNFIEVSLEAAYDVLGGSVATQIRRAVPEISSILQFGLRSHPGVLNTPFITNARDAEIFGLMMIARSFANRYSGSLTVIEDSAIKVGNPIRMFMYDEHPFQSTGKFDNVEFPVSQQDNPEAVFYVTGIERSIDPKGVSYMTLHLKAGRMMGQESLFDISTPLYKLYYEEVMDMDITTELSNYTDYYKTKFKVFYPTLNDSIESIINSYSKDGKPLAPALKEEIGKAILSINAKIFGHGVSYADLLSKNSILMDVANKGGKIYLPDPGSIRDPKTVNPKSS